MYHPIQGHSCQWHHSWLFELTRRHSWCHWHLWPCIGRYIAPLGRCICLIQIEWLAIQTGCLLFTKFLFFSNTKIVHYAVLLACFFPLQRCLLTNNLMLKNYSFFKFHWMQDDFWHEKITQTILHLVFLSPDKMPFDKKNVRHIIILDCIHNRDVF